MKGYLSIVKYYPDSNRDEGFGIGLILISDESDLSIVKFSNDRLKRINSAFGIKKSSLLDHIVEEISNKKFDKKTLDYNAVYDNGNLRISKPQLIDSPNLSSKFTELYSKFVADYYEEDLFSQTVRKKELSHRYGQKLRKQFKSDKFLNERLNIGYNFKENSIRKFLIGNSKIDFIGGNGSVYAGEILDLDLNEETLQQNFNKTIALFEALSKTYVNKFDPKECKFLVLRDQALDKTKSEYMDILNTWKRKAEYDLLIEETLNDFKKRIAADVETKNIIKYDEWLKTL